MSIDNLFLGGVPTKPDVTKLRETIGVPKEGDTITYETFEKIIGQNRKTFRFKTVLNAWRKAMFSEHNLVFEADHGVGLTCLPPDERVEFGVAKEKSGLRIIGRAARVVGLTDKTRLTPDNLKAATHMEARVAAIKLAMATAPKAISLPKLDKQG